MSGIEVSVECVTVYMVELKGGVDEGRRNVRGTGGGGGKSMVGGIDRFCGLYLYLYLYL